MESKEWADLVCCSACSQAEPKTCRVLLICFPPLIHGSDLAFEEDLVVKASAMGETREVVNAAIARGCPQPKGDVRDETAKRLPV